MTASTLRTRWQPLRGGLINLFKYEDQIFRYENGKLLLRGNNGSGKSRVLALQLPFLFDGDLSPYRVEPDRDPAKRMEWHLLMDMHERRTGYTWLEFGRRDDDGTEHFVTIGCGMEARKGGGAPNRWFFVTPDRVGEGLKLVENRVPLSRSQLNANFQAFERGQVFEKSSDYREAVDQALFKLGPRRYRPLIDLLIQLRQPQLMREMKEDVLSNALSEALPPVRDELINQVAESFQSLEADRRHTQDHREMRDTVESFREGYRQYLSVAVRRLCEVVRLEHSLFERCTKDLRTIEEDLEKNETLIVETTTVRDSARTSLIGFQGVIEELKNSPEMRSAHELEQATQRAAELTSEEASFQKKREETSTQLAQEEAEVGCRSERLHKCEEEAESSHRLVIDLHSLVAPAAKPPSPWREASPVDEKKLVVNLVQERHRGVSHLEGKNHEISKLANLTDIEKRRCEEHRQSVNESDDALRQTAREVKEEVGGFGVRVLQWEHSLSQLHVTAFPRGRDWSGELGEWVEEPEGIFPFQAELQKGSRVVQQELSREAAELRETQKETVRVQSEVATSLEKLRAGHQPEPPVPHIRSSDRARFAGAPFWKLFEFKENIPSEEHAAWEAALESAGLLDAWIFPDGRLENSLLNDTALTLIESGAGDSLQRILRPAQESEVLSKLLSQIGSHVDAGSCWVSRDGRWANGPLTGHWKKDEAAHLGHEAREASRQRKINELEEQLTELEKTTEQLARELSRNSARQSELTAEIERAPTFDALRDLLSRRDHEQELLTRQKGKLLESEERVIAAQAGHRSALLARAADAADLHLSDWQEPEALAKFSALLVDFERACQQLWSAWEKALASQEELAAARTRCVQTKDRATVAEKDFQGKHAAAGRARSRAETLRANIGATVEEVLEKLAKAQEDAVHAEGDLSTAGEAIQEARIREAGLREKKEYALEKRSDAEASRNRAVARMEVFVSENIFAEIDPAHQPERATFSPSAAVELARRLEQELKSSPLEDGHWQKLQSEIAQAFNEFMDQLGRHGLLPQLRVIDENSVSLITCDFQGKNRSLETLSRLIEEELASRQRIFEEREREIIENHLIGEAAASLQTCIREGENWVRDVNQELESITTSSGIQLKFDWGIADQEDEQLVAIRKIFLKTSAAWTPIQRGKIGDFLQKRIRQSQEEDEAVTWREHLIRALDYRAWHRFGILRRTPGDQVWKKLTKRTFGTGSGGEKAMTLTVPQFAAAAAHYRSAHKHAPRLILLDEVFVAIDAETRERLMGLLETLDLDYVMTSEREWGTYPTVSALAIYQLATRQGYNAVAVTRWVWNGKEKLRDAEAPRESSQS